MKRTLLSIGHGYSARALAQRLLTDDWRIYGTTRSAEKADALEKMGVNPVIWPGNPLPIDRVTHVLSSVGPGDDGDPVLTEVAQVLRKARHLLWVGYLSTTGVYGDHAGRWVDETTPLEPTTKRGMARKKAESEWAALGLPLHIFRLAGIYGPGRGPFSKVRKGTARRIIKEGQVFSRIHVDDIAQVLHASIQNPSPGAIFNVCDDDPAPPQDVIEYAADLIGKDVPPAIAFEDAELSEMARSFYAESKRVKNLRIKEELGVKLLYPDYRAGLNALVKVEAEGA